MKNTDLTTIISGVLGVALIAMAAVVLLYEPANIVFAGSLVAGALGLNGYNAALLAPSPKQGEQIARAVAATTPQVPLVNITHNTPADTQVSGAALPLQPASTQPVNTPSPMVHQGLVNVAPGQGTLTYMMPPQGTAVQTGAVMEGVTMFAPPDVLPGGPSISPVIPFPPPQGQDWRNWTGLTQVPPTQQQ